MLGTRATIKQEKAALVFTALLTMSTLVFQRFSISIGSSYLSIVGPIGFLLAGYGLLKGALEVHKARLDIFILLVAWIALGGAIRAVVPVDWGTESSWLSAGQFIVFTSFGILAFAHPVDEVLFFRVVNTAFVVVGIAGIVQFVLQFTGLSLFSFDDLVPESLIFKGYQTIIPIGASGYLKSNGFFLVEPSAFSQIMALALIIELLTLRRSLYLVIFAIGLMTSISGTGWVMIVSFVLTASFTLGWLGVKLSAATIALSIVAFGSFAVVFPDGFDLFVARTTELNGMGSSGHNRFITPWWLVQYVLDRTPWVALYGLGSGVTDHMGMHPPWDYDTNPPVKIGLEYGFPSVVLYLIYLMAGHRTRIQKSLIAPALVLLLLDGGNSHFPPVLFLVFLIISIADLAPSGSRVPQMQIASLPQAAE